MNWLIKFTLETLLKNNKLTGKERGMINNIIKTKI